MSTVKRTVKKSKLSIVNEAVAKQQVTSIDHLEDFYQGLIENLTQEIDDKKYDLEGEERDFNKEIKSLQGKLKDARKVVEETWTNVHAKDVTTTEEINAEIPRFWHRLEKAKSVVEVLESQIILAESNFSELKSNTEAEIAQMTEYLEHLQK